MSGKQDSAIYLHICTGGMAVLYSAHQKIMRQLATATQHYLYRFHRSETGVYICLERFRDIVQ